MPGRNPEARRARTWLLFGLGGMAGIFAPSLLGIDGFKGGFALSALSLMIGLGGLIGALAYRGRARALQGLLDGDDLIVRWTYPPEQWTRYAAAEAAREASAHRTTFVVLVLISALVSAGFVLADPKSGRWVVLALFVVIALAKLASVLSLRGLAGRRQGGGEALVGTDAVYLAGTLHSWSGFGGRLEKADRVDAEGALIEVDYSFPTRGGRTHAQVHVPIPRGEEAEAERVVAALQAAAFADRRQ
jgi:hypothetical protein